MKVECQYVNAQQFVWLPGGAYTTVVYVCEGNFASTRSGGASRGLVKVRFSTISWYLVWMLWCPELYSLLMLSSLN